MKKVIMNLLLLSAICISVAACGPISISADVPEIPLPQVQVTVGGGSSDGGTVSNTPQPANPNNQPDANGSTVDPNAIAILGYILLALAGAILLIALFSILRRPDRPNGGDRE